MNMKKITALFMSAIMLFSSANLVFAENTEVTADLTAPPKAEILDTDEFRALYAMGFVGVEMTEAEKDSLITRALFTGYLFKLSGYPLTEYKTADIPFTDVSLETPYCSEICTMYEKGIVNGTDPGKFSPDAHITYAQACKLIVDVLGYRNHVALKYGEYPEGYVAMAAELEINKGVKNVVWNSELTAEDAMTMLYNAGFAEVMKFSGLNQFGTPVYETNGVDLFGTNNIYFSEGVMESNGIVSTVDEYAPENATVISGKQYVSADADLTNLIGCKVKYFYRDTKTEKKLLWAYEDTRFNKVIELKAYELATDDSAYSVTNVVYYDKNGKKDYIKVDDLASVIYNNSLYLIPTEDIMKPKTGTVRFIDKNDDKIFETVIIEEFFNVFVNNVSPMAKTIVDKYNRTIALNDYNLVKVIKDGKEIDFTQIGANTLLSCVENKEKTAIYIYVMTDSGKSVLKSVGSTRNRYVYNFEDGSYRLSNQYNEFVNKYKASQATPNPSATPAPGSDNINVVPVVDPVPGKTYTYYLDMAGEIAEVQDPRTELQYALLMSAKPGPDYEENVVYTRLLMTDGGKVSGITKKKLMIDGERKNSSELMKHPSLKDNKGKVLAQVVKVSFDDEGYLKEIYFAEDCTDTTLYPYGYNATKFSKDYAGNKHIRLQDGFYMLDSKYMFDNQTTIFIKWNGLDESEPYSVTTRTALKTGDMPMEIYDAGSDMIVPVAYMPTYFNAQEYWMGGRMIVEGTDVIFEDGQELSRVTGYISGERKTVTEYFPGVIPTDLEKGDIIRISHHNGRATKIVKDLSVDQFADKTPRVMEGTSPDQETAVRFVPVYNVSNLGVVSINPDEWVASYGKLNTAGFKSGNTLLVIIYDSKTGEISTGDIHDIYQLYSPNADGTLPDEDDMVMAYIYTRYSTLQEIIIVL